MRNSEIARCISVGSDISSSLGVIVVVVVVDLPVPLPVSGPAVGQRLRRTLDMSERSGAEGAIWSLGKNE